MTHTTNDAPVTVEQIAARLIDQSDEPWPQGTTADRLHYWRDKAIDCSNRLAALASAPVGDGGYRVNPDRSGLERMTMMDDEMGLPDEPMPPSPNAIPQWHGEAAHKALLASSEPVAGVYEQLIEDVQTLLTPPGNEWSGHEPPIQSEAWHLIERRMNEIDASTGARAAVGERDEKEIGRIVRWIDQVIERARKHGNTEGLWLFASQWQTVRDILALQSPPAKVEG